MSDHNTYGQLEMLGKTDSVLLFCTSVARKNCKSQGHSIGYISVHQMKANEGRRCKKIILSLLTGTHESNLLEDLL